jgi:hypothetical protein
MKLIYCSIALAILISAAPSQAQNSAQRPATVTIYVSAQDGNDGFSGRLAAPNCKIPGCAAADGPFATLDRAREFIWSLNKTGLKEVIVQLRGGTYYLAKTAMFGSADSGSPATEIIFENYPGETPVISGGMRVQNWTHASGNKWTASLPAATTADFENLYYNGVRRLRPRLAAEGTAEPAAYLGTYFRIVGPVYLPAQPAPGTTDAKNCTLDVAGSGWECFDRFYYNPSDPISSAWSNLAPPASANPNCAPSNGNTAPPGDIELVDFEQYSVAKLRVSCVDTNNHVVYLTGSTAFEVDHPAANGYIPDHRYLIENVEDSLALPGQWFLDRSSNVTWTLTYLANAGEDPNRDAVVVPQLPQILVASNLQYVTFRGITFAHDNYTLAPGGYGGLAALIAGVSFQNSQHITFDSSTVSQTSAVGLEFISCVDATSPNWCVSTNTNAITAFNQIENSTFYDLGANAIRIGNSGQSSDTQQNVPQFNAVWNNVVEGYGRVFAGSTGIVQGQGHDNLYSHNEVYDGYKGAIHVCYCSDSDPSGVLPDNNVISFNRVFNLFQGIMNDSGSLYFGVGTPNTGTGLPPASGVGNKLLNNVVHDVSDASTLDADGYGGDGLYLDDFTGRVDVENNLVYRVSASAISFSGPRAGANQESDVHNNIFAYMRRSIIEASNPYSFTAVPPSPLFFVAANNLYYFDRNGNSPNAPYPAPAPFYVQGGCTYAGDGVPYTDFQVWNYNLYWRTDMVFAGDPQAFHVQSKPDPMNTCLGPLNAPAFNFAGWQGFDEDDQSAVRNPHFKNPAYPADDYSLPQGAPIPGFIIFDPNEAGRLNPAIQPPAVPATFPTLSFNPATDF